MYGIIYFKKSEDIKALERTLKLLAGYHACKLTDGKFQTQYRHLIVMYRNLCKEQGITKCLI